MHPLPTLKSLVNENKKVFFSHYTMGDLWYRTEGGNFEFPVPISDTQNGVFLAEDKAILFMRYIRRHLEMLQQEIALQQV